MRWTVRALIGILTLVFVAALPGPLFFAREAISWEFGGLITCGLVAVFAALMVLLYRMASARPGEMSSSRRIAVAVLSLASLLLVGTCALAMWAMVQVGIGMAEGDRLQPQPPETIDKAGQNR